MMSSEPKGNRSGPTLSSQEIHNFISEIFGSELHAKRVLSVANGVTGVLRSSSLSVSAIGKGLAAEKGLLNKHAIKQVDRMLSNHKIELESFFVQWISHCLCEKTQVVCNLDWTEFNKDKQATIMLSLQSNQGRSKPLIWKTHRSTQMKNNRNDYEDELLSSFFDILTQTGLSQNLKVTIVADRGFADSLFFSFLKEELGFDYIIRIRSNIWVSNSKGESRFAAAWVGKGGRMKVWKQAGVTREKTRVPGFLSVRDKGMKETWNLVFSDSSAKGSQVKKLYGKRFSCEETHRDLKSPRFGMGLKWTRISSPIRRDRIVMLASLAHTLLSLLGAAGEECGLDKTLKPNTSKKRVYSLFTQGRMWFDAIPNMPEERLRKLMTAYEKVLTENRFAAWIWSAETK